MKTHIGDHSLRQKVLLNDNQKSWRVVQAQHVGHHLQVGENPIIHMLTKPENFYIFSLNSTKLPAIQAMQSHQFNFEFDCFCWENEMIVLSCNDRSCHLYRWCWHKLNLFSVKVTFKFIFNCISKSNYWNFRQILIKLSFFNEWDIKYQMYTITYNQITQGVLIPPLVT